MIDSKRVASSRLESSHFLFSLSKPGVLIVETFIKFFYYIAKTIVNLLGYQALPREDFIEIAFLKEKYRYIYIDIYF